MVSHDNSHLAATAEEKITVNSEYSSLPEVVPAPNQSSAQTPGPSYAVSPLTPGSTPGFAASRPVRPPPPFSPDSFDPYGGPAKPYQSFHHNHQQQQQQQHLAPPPYGYPPEPPSPVPSFVPPVGGHDAYPPLMDSYGGGGPPPGPLPAGMPSVVGGSGGLGPVAAARRRRRMRIWIAGGVCAALLIITIGVVAGILLGWIHIQVKKNNPSTPSGTPR